MANACPYTLKSSSVLLLGRLAAAKVEVQRVLAAISFLSYFDSVKS